MTGSFYKSSQYKTRDVVAQYANILNNNYVVHEVNAQNRTIHTFIVNEKDLPSEVVDEVLALKNTAFNAVKLPPLSWVSYEDGEL